MSYKFNWFFYPGICLGIKTMYEKIIVRSKLEDSSEDEFYDVTVHQLLIPLVQFELVKAEPIVNE